VDGIIAPIVKLVKGFLKKNEKNLKMM